VGDYAFDEDSRVVAAGSSGEFAAELTSRWNGTAGAVNGGYMLATCLQALALDMPFPDPIVVSGFFLRPGAAGPAAVRTSVIRSGRTMAFGEAALIQDGKDIVRATAAFAKLGDAGRDGDSTGQDATGQDGPVFLDGTPPALPPPAECVGVPVASFGLAMPSRGGLGGSSPRASIAERIEFRSAELPGWFRGQPSGRPASEFWMRFADGRPADLLSLPLLVDSTAPSVLELGAGSTTIQLTVHLRAHPAPGWLACRATTRFVSNGYHEEDFEVWDSAGALVAQSRQLALIRPS
jgi:acyl-CoA thioesterase